MRPIRLKQAASLALEDLQFYLSFVFFLDLLLGGEATCPEGPARQIDVSRQNLSPHCLEAIFDSQLPSPKLSPKMPPKLSVPTREGFFFLFQNCPAVRAIARQVGDKIVSRQFLPRDINLSLLAHWWGEKPIRKSLIQDRRTSAWPPC